MPYFWIPEDNLKKRVNRDHVPYDVWETQGYIRTTPGNVVDYRWIEEDIKKIASEFIIKEIAYDDIFFRFYCENEEYAIECRNFMFFDERIGKTVFLTREAAEQALKGGAEK